MADIDTASEDYAGRFAGAAGQWMLQAQEYGTSKLLQKTGSVNTILEVGGGHAQLTDLFLKSADKLVVVGSAPSAGTRLAPYVQAPKCNYEPANLLKLPFPENAFDIVACFRLLTHCEQWEQLIHQLCRTSAKYVIVDYPTSQSINAIAPLFFGAKKKIEKNTRFWHSFLHRDVNQAFNQNGYEIVATYKQFFWPMALHRMLKNAGYSRFMEAIPRSVGLTYLMGSPVIALYRNKEAQNQTEKVKNDIAKQGHGA